MRLTNAYLGCLYALLLASAAAAADLLPPAETVERAIDHYIDARLTDEGVSAAPPADDANLLRRTMLDLTGRIPTAGEAQAYLADEDADKRAKLVQRLMDSPAFIRQQAAEFDALLMRGTKSDLREYLAMAFREQRSWDQMFRELLLGQDDDKEQKGAITFVKARIKDPDQLTNDASVLFFGVNVSCAKCHDHPLVADWTQEHYFGMKSFFSRTYEAGKFIGEKDAGVVEYKTVAGESRTARLMFLTGDVVAEPESAAKDEDPNAEKQRREKDKHRKEPPPPPSYSRRAQLVEAALKPGADRFFSRAIVNHLWNRLLGRGLVMPVDQMHSENAPSHPELLEWLARDMQTHGYDLRRLIRGIVLSRTYARTSQWNSADERPADFLFATAIVRPLMPWQYGTSLRVASTSPDSFPATLTPEQLDQRMQGSESSGRSLASSLEVPGAEFQVSVDEALFLSNGERVMKELLREGNDSLVTKLNGLDDPRAVAETAIWNVFTRPPDEGEVESLTKYLESHGERREAAIAQMTWALLTSSECRFNY
jgi:hypothetical protein